MADSLFVLLQKVAFTLSEEALKKLSSEVVEAASVLMDIKRSMKQIEREFVIMQTFISQVSRQKLADRTFDAWLDQVRAVAHEVEDIIDEYAYLSTNTEGTGGFFKRRFGRSKSISAWHNISTQLNQVEAQIQRLKLLRDCYGMSIDDMNRKNKLQYDDTRLIHSASAYFTDEGEIVGNIEELRRLKSCLVDGKKERTIVSIYGMGGLGKTTITSNIYKNQEIKRKFDCYAWTSVSQSYQVDDLLRRIIKQLLGNKRTTHIDTMECINLVEVLQSYLLSRSYLVVLDDVWDRSAWSLLNHAFAKNNMGSRVVITTRRKEVAALADKNHDIQLKPLSDAEAWELFCQKAFYKTEDKKCPQNVRLWAEKIVRRCQGLPLAVVAIGSLLSYREMEQQEWKSFYNQLNWQLANSPELNSVASVLNLSMDDLPTYLRNCFFYCSLFPEDYKIKRKWLIRLWIAEGFIENQGAGTKTEEVAECYLKEIIDRSLLQVIERNAQGRARSFRLHDLVREITLILAKKEKFATVCNDLNVTQSDTRRLCIQRDYGSIQFSLGSQQLRSFISFSGQMTSAWICNVQANFRLLRVLCIRFVSIQKVPDVVMELFNLHYLDLSSTAVKHIPSSVGKLKKLQMLDLRGSRVEVFPHEITELTKLQHLHASCFYDYGSRVFDYVSATEVRGSICSLTGLQSLATIAAKKDLVAQLGNLTLLRNLVIMKVRRSYVSDLCSSLARMPELKKLGIWAYDKEEVLNLEDLEPLPNLRKLFLKGKLEGGAVPPIFSCFEELSDLRMEWSGLRQDPICSLSHMSNLVDLYLYRVYDGDQLTFCARWFPKLRSLYLGGMERLNWIELKDGTMGNLHQLELSGLSNLRSLPEGIKYHLSSLHRMYLTDMPDELIARMQGIDRHIVHGIPNIHVLDGSVPFEDSTSLYSRQYATKYCYPGMS